MKILAIRGAGLASLSEPFEVSLHEGALAQAGVFAIVGPTGAGKSTLLDALFLALFGDTPRLTNQQRVRLPARKGDGDKGESITTRDARGLARGDVSLAFAEVDFTGVDGARYRARWEVRRKRGEGAFRKPVHALSALVDGAAQRIGGTKTEVLGHVVARLGLDFDQFRRSVVLAQGEIAAFLHAPDRDRAELLERITGTEIYGEISREIHLETVRQRERAALLMDQLATTAVMDAAARRAAEQAVSTAHLNALAAEQARQSDEVELARHQSTLELASERDDAVAALRELDDALTCRAREVQQVRLARAVAGLLPILRAVQRADDDVAVRTSAREAAARAAEQAQAGEPEEEAAHAAAQQAARDAEDALSAASTALLHAEHAETVAREHETRAHQTILHGATLEDARARALAEQDVAEAEHADAARAIASWDQQRSRWPALERVLSRVVEPDDTVARAERILVEREAIERASDGAAALGASLRLAVERAEHAELECRARLEASSARASRAQRQLDEALLQLEGAAHQSDDPAPARSPSAPVRAYARPLEAPLLARERALGDGLIGTAAAQPKPELAGPPERALGLGALLRRSTELRRKASETERTLTKALAGLEQLTQAHAKRRAEHARDRIDRARFADELARLAEELEQAGAEAASADRALEAGLRARHAAELRAHLVAGHPCEVCGATEHPRARRPEHDIVPGELGPGELVPGELGPGELVPRDHSSADPATLRARRDEAFAERARLSSRHLAVEAAFRLTLASPQHAGGDDAERAASGRLAKIRAQLDELDLALTSLDEAEREARQASDRVRDEDAASARARDEAGRARAELRTHDAEATERARRASALAEESASLGLEVLEACAEGQRTTAFLRDALASRAAAERAGARLDLLDTQRIQLRTQLESLDARIAQHREALTLAHGACAHASEASRAAQAAKALHAARSHARARAQQRLREATARLDAARATVRDAREALARADAVLAEATTRAEALRLEVEEHVSVALRSPELASMAGDGSERARASLLREARALAARDPAELADRARSIDELERAREHAAAVATERARRLESHALGLDGSGAPAFDRSVTTERVEALSIALEARRRSEVALRSELSRREHEIERDDVARAARDEKAAAVSAAREELLVWEDLLDALGSADGKKLRVHAQRLTLRALVREASLHLEAIAPRYAIEVVEGGDLAIQVSDRALGGEVRALGALSGGETFLVSLALALALRGLTSEQVQIASLFIDEGFGSLDEGSLDTVLSALDALEATGRQVGIVSHVPEVKERFAARIEVVPRGGGKSIVRVAA